MAFKFLFFFALVAYAQAGLLGTPTITSQEQNILRTPGNLGQISTFSKTIDTPYSSVSKSDVRISNPGVAVHGAQLAYSSPIASAHYAAPAQLAYSSPIASAHYAAPAQLAYSSPIASAHYAAPAQVAYSSPAHYAAPAAVAYSSPAHYAAPALAAPLAPAHYASPLGVAKVATPALLGVAYSAAPAVSHMTYSNGLGLAYSW